MKNKPQEFPMYEAWASENTFICEYYYPKFEANEPNPPVKEGWYRAASHCHFRIGSFEEGDKPCTWPNLESCSFCVLLLQKVHGFSDAIVMERHFGLRTRKPCKTWKPIEAIESIP